MTMPRHDRHRPLLALLLGLVFALPCRAGNGYGLPPEASDGECRRLAELWYASPEGMTSFPPLSPGLRYDEWGRVVGRDGETGSLIEGGTAPDCRGRGDWFLRNWSACRDWVRRRLEGGEAPSSSSPSFPSSSADPSAATRDKGPVTGEPAELPAGAGDDEIPVEVFGNGSDAPPAPMAPSSESPTGNDDAILEVPDPRTEGGGETAPPVAESASTPSSAAVSGGPYAPRDGETWFDPMGANDWGGRKAFIERYGTFGQTSMVDALVAKFVEVCPASGQRAGFTFDCATGFYEILDAMEKGGYTFDDGRTGWAPLQAFVDDGNVHMNAGREIGIRKR